MSTVFENTTLVKQRWPDLPIILMSGSASNFIEDGCPNSGVDCLLNKPFTMVQLREAIAWVQARYADKSSEDKLSAGPSVVPLSDPRTDPGSNPMGREH